jgi:hypothetical protein
MFVSYVRETLKQIMVTFAYGQHKFTTSAKCVSIISKTLGKMQCLREKSQTMSFDRFLTFLKNSYAAGVKAGVRVCQHYALDGVFTVFAFFIRPGLGLFWTFIFVFFWIPFFQ